MKQFLRSITLSPEKSNTLLLLFTCALVLAPHAIRQPLWTSLLCALILLWRGWITLRGQRMPSRWILLPITAAALAATLFTYKSILGREPGLTLLALLLTLKLLEMHARRDLFTVLFTACFLVLANFFYSQTIFMALMMIVTVVAILVTQISFQYSGALPPLRQRMKQGGFILLLAVPVSLILFLLVPRIQGPLWALPNDASSAQVGLSDSMAPGNISELANSDAVAFRVSFDGPIPARAALYWRGIVLSNFDGRRWTSMQNVPQTPPPTIEVQWQGARVKQQITLEPHHRPWLFALDLPSDLPNIPGMRARLTPEVQLLASAPVQERIRYQVTSSIRYTLQPNQTAEDLRPWLALPPDFNPRTHALAAELRSAVPNSAALIRTVLQRFHDQPFRYTLSPPLLGRDSVDEFLFTSRAGFCEHYAGSFVVLMRAAGIPARVVTGYQGGETNPVDGVFTVRQSDAHAWAEVWLAGEGWRRVDPTAAVAPERVEKNLAATIPASPLAGFITFNLGRDSFVGQFRSKLRNEWEAFNHQWNQVVLGYSTERQLSMLRLLGVREPDLTALGLVLIAGVILSLALTLLPLMWNRRRRDKVSTLYDAFCRFFARRGLVRLQHEGPRSYGERIAQAVSEQGSRISTVQSVAAQEFLVIIENLRYAPLATTRQDDRLVRLNFLLNLCRKS